MREGELISNVVNGWNFGDAHFHGAQLLEAVQERCGFAAGDVRLVYLESESTMRRRGYQHYEVWDPVDGMLEQGTVAVKDMVTSQPWLDESFDFPVVVESGAVGQDRPLPVGGSESARYSPSR